jgi:predicted Ser/Thr protein kinase
MADGAQSDELARTATAPSSTSEPKEPAPPLGDTLGRYRLERALGEGGMGVVHAAFDPDLERRVALKVLRTTDVSGEARQRLLREARAMARLTHPNVVTVHEVGSANGRDYVAMELVEGETLADWLRAKTRTQAEIIDVFRAAARGLAAAHAAGLVHRDFKPHNVLRRRDGRICVTDFGLARGVEAGTPAIGLEATLRMNSAEIRKADATPSSLSGLTATGSVLGTPAYMAPEQWTGGTVGPAADQFGYCVALWEALCGERPFRGATIDDLKREVARGPDKLAAQKLPRRLRPILLRGLDPDPDKRWPSMDELLGAITRAERRPQIAILGAGVLVAGVALYLVLGRGGDSCARPLLDPAKVWTSERAAALATANQTFGADALAADVARWQDVRVGACKSDPEVRVAKLACLDGVLALIDAQARALAQVHDTPNADIGVLSIDPKVCDTARPPRLVSAMSDARITATTALLRYATSPDPLEPAAADDLVKHTTQDPCAAAIGRLVSSNGRETQSERKRDLEEAESAAQRCGDDRLIADTMFNSALNAVKDREADFLQKIKRAESAAQVVMQPDVQAAFDHLRGELAQHDDRVDEAMSQYQAARDGYAARGRLRAQLGEELAMMSLRQIRGRPEDLSAIPKQLEDWRALAAKRLGTSDEMVRSLDESIAGWKFALGDVTSFHQGAMALKRERPLRHKVQVTGRVIDDQGAPVSGATVTAGSSLTADSIGLLPGSDQRSAVTGADGSFALAEAVADGEIVALLGDRRSQAIRIGEHVELTIAPTSHIEGHVDLRGMSPVNVIVVARDPSKSFGGLHNIAPVKPDGTFALDGVPRGKIMLHAELARANTGMLTGTPVDATAAVVRDVQLTVPTSKRTIYVVVRSTSGMQLTTGVVMVLPGKVTAPTVGALAKMVQDVLQREAVPIEGEHAPQAVLKIAKRGDLYAAVPEAPEQVASACAISLPSDANDAGMDAKIMANLDRIELRCVTIEEKDEVVLVEVPPFPRLD